MSGKYRVRFTIAGGHVHCHLFYGEEGKTFAKCGDFVTRRGAEFRDLVDSFSADFIGDDPRHGIAAAIKDEE